MTNAKMYLSEEMAEFVIEEFSKNNVNYHAINNIMLENEEIVTEITYDQNQHFVGNHIFTAAVAYSNHFLKRIDRRLTGDKIIEEAMNKFKYSVTVEEVKPLNKHPYFVVNRGDDSKYIKCFHYKEEADNDPVWGREVNLKEAMQYVKLLESGVTEKKSTIYKSENDAD